MRGMLLVATAVSMALLASEVAVADTVTTNFEPPFVTGFGQRSIRLEERPP